MVVYPKRSKPAKKGAWNPSEFGREGDVSATPPSDSKSGAVGVQRAPVARLAAHRTEAGDNAEKNGIPRLLVPNEPPTVLQGSPEDGGSSLEEESFLEKGSVHVHGRDVSSSVKPVLKSAMKSPSSTPKGLHVQWDPDVKDPLPTSASHTVGKGKVVMSSRRSRRYANKNGHGKSGKQGKAHNKGQSKANPDPQKEVPIPALAAVKSKATDATAVCDDGLSEVSGSDPEDVACKGGTDVSICKSAVAQGLPEDEGEHALKAVECQDALSQKVADTVNPQTDSPAKQKLVVKVPGSEGRKEKALENASLKRLAGATALASGDVDSSAKILKEALALAQEVNSAEEQARCFRLIADTLCGPEREASMTAALACFAKTHLPFEHAEAVLCFVQYTVQEQLDGLSIKMDAWTNVGLPYAIKIASSSKTAQALADAKAHLQTAAGLLLEHEASLQAHGSSSASPTGSPTGRRRKAKKNQALFIERAATMVLLGSVHELWGKVCMILDEKEEGYSHLMAAAANEIWKQDSPEEARHVQLVLDSLRSSKAPSCRSIRPPCTVY